MKNISGLVHLLLGWRNVQTQKIISHISTMGARIRTVFIIDKRNFKPLSHATTLLYFLQQPIVSCAGNGYHWGLYLELTSVTSIYKHPVFFNQTYEFCYYKFDQLVWLKITDIICSSLYSALFLERQIFSAVLATIPNIQVHFWENTWFVSTRDSKEWYRAIIFTSSRYSTLAPFP